MAFIFFVCKFCDYSILFNLSLKHFNISSTGDKEALLSRYQKKVLEVGVANFIKKLKSAEVKASCKALSVKTSSDNEETRNSLEEKVSTDGINALIEAVDESTLKKFCSTLSLEPGVRGEMIQQIADEVMLTGMESFLNKLPVGLLKSHCQELKLDTNGAKNDLVERLMVSIFELEPLNDDGHSKSKKKVSSEKKADKSDDEKQTTTSKRKSSSSPKKGSSKKKKNW